MPSMDPTLCLSWIRHVTRVHPLVLAAIHTLPSMEMTPTHAHPSSSPISTPCLPWRRRATHVHPLVLPAIHTLPYMETTPTRAHPLVLAAIHALPSMETTSTSASRSHQLTCAQILCCSGIRMTTPLKGKPYQVLAVHIRSH
jgi:hypothetical protein